MSLAHTKGISRCLIKTPKSSLLLCSELCKVRRALSLQREFSYLGIWCVEAHDSNIPFDITADVGSVCKQTQGWAQLLPQAF